MGFAVAVLLSEGGALALGQVVAVFDDPVGPSDPVSACCGILLDCVVTGVVVLGWGSERGAGEDAVLVSEEGDVEHEGEPLLVTLLLVWVVGSWWRAHAFGPGRALVSVFGSGHRVAGSVGGREHLHAAGRYPTATPVLASGHASGCSSPPARITRVIRPGREAWSCPTRPTTR